MKIGIIREGKSPADSRVVLSPEQCKMLIQEGVDLVVQRSNVRCYADEAYQKAGVPLVDDLSDRDILLGVKEVPVDLLIPEKTYFFFSHTIKKQSYNQPLLKAIIDKNIRLLDYEVLTDDSGARKIAFGKFAGMVGAHNALWTYGMRSKVFEMDRMNELYDYNAAQEQYKHLSIPNIKIVLTGTGRVANGAALVLKDMDIQKVRPIDYVTKQYDTPVFTQLHSFYYAKRKDGNEFDNVQDFYNNPQDYESDFDHFLPMTDIMINGIYWDNAAPAFFTADQMASKEFGIRVIADVTCDIVPISSIPSTLRATTIEDPVFGYDRKAGIEIKPFEPGGVDMMTIDNLPNEMPRDASAAFGEMFIEHVLPEMRLENSEMLTRATIAENGKLGPHFQYLKDYLEG